MALGIHDEELLRRVVSNWKLTPATFAHKISRGRWIAAPWLMYVSQIIAQAIANGNGRIIISAPPRHGKSKLVDVYLPAWTLENFPEKEIILTSYGADLSEDFGRECRDLMLDNEALLNTKVRKDAQKVSNFRVEGGGGMRSVGLGGSITGKGADVLIVDDYIKEIKEALSPTYRDYVWNWFTTTAYTRLEPGGTCIIIATRWHSDDLIGRILRNFPGRWTNIVLPAIAEKGDILGREPGVPLFPERYDLEILMERMEVLGTSFFQALFQQRPLDEAKKLADGEWLKVVQIAPSSKKLKWARVWDLAATEDGGDYTTGALCSYDQITGFFYINNIIRKQMSPGDVERLVLNTAIADGTSTEILIEQEPGSSGKALVNHFTTNILPEFKVTPVPAVKSKVIRAQPLLAGAEAGKVFLLQGQWNQQYIREFDTFPGMYDDQVDVTGAGYTHLTGKKYFTTTWGRDGVVPRTHIVQANKQQRAMQFGLASRGPSPSWGRKS